MPTKLADGLGLRDVPLFTFFWVNKDGQRFAPKIGSSVPAIALQLNENKDGQRFAPKIGSSVPAIALQLNEGFRLNAGLGWLTEFRFLSS
jgi:hypothetical protein